MGSRSESQQSRTGKIIHGLQSGKTDLTHRQLLYAFQFLYGGVVPLTKLSIVLLYRRLFPTRQFSYVLHFCTFLVVGWAVAVFIVNLLQCKPISYFWLQFTDPTAKGKCIDWHSYFIGNASASVVSDFIILLAPLPLIWQLHMPLGQRLATMGIFAVGAL